MINAPVVALEEAVVALTLNWTPSSTLATSVASYCWKIISLASTVGLIITSLEEFEILKTSVPPSLNSKPDVPKSTSLSVTGFKT